MTRHSVAVVVVAVVTLDSFPMLYKSCCPDGLYSVVGMTLMIYGMLFGSGWETISHQFPEFVTNDTHKETETWTAAVFVSYVY